MFDTSKIPDLSTSRLLALYRRYRYYRHYDYDLYDEEDSYCNDYNVIADTIKSELDKREHVDTNGRKKERLKHKQQCINRAKAKRRRKFNNQLEQYNNRNS